MQAIQHWGIEFIVSLQAMGTPLWDSFFSFISHLGAGGYLLVIPLFIWCIEPRLGLRALLAMMISQYIVMLLKDIVQEPRPFLADARIISNGEHGYSFPSGHAMGSMVFYGLIALWTQKPWLKWSMLALIFFIGLSRSYLGVHYPHDVITGWVMGIIYLWGWLKLQRGVEQRYHRLPFSLQLLSALLIPALVGSIHNAIFDYPYALAISGAVSATLLCMIAERKKPLLSAEGSGLQKTGRYLVGTSLLFLGLILVGQWQPETAGLLQDSSIWLTGALLVIIIGYIAPRVFVALKLSPGR